MSTKTEVLPTGISRLAVNAVVITTILTALGIILAVLRFKLRKREAIGVDDYVLMAALVFLSLQLAFCYMIGFLSGEGWETEDLVQRPERVTWILKLIYFPELSYTVVVVLIKTSILYSYNRIFGRVKTTRYHIYALLGLTWVWGIVFFFIIIFQCTPVDKAWIPAKPGHCFATVPFLWGNSISNFVIDWLILAVPVLPVLRLQLSLTQKSLVGLSFLFGSLACIASTIRSVKTSTFDESNLGISDYNASIWVYIEAPLATISCCLPFLSRLFGIKSTQFVKRIKSHITKGSDTGAMRIHSENSSGPADISLEDHKHLVPQSQSIHMNTTTTVESRVAGQGVHDMNSYNFSVAAPARTLSRGEPTTSLV
ncbi:uncharacterized protein F4822DRAFT_415016 [Hypoxylon trugodes]|uniref:uncharacterized protein n=1 Tax=Hypoxylon trugodes TaxID=326681 RepID=UPI00219841D4|nr:uncharacterized protein F4822DRAFT_415016 [Hypoxylon trugodes]KAI1384396.1 hypothetical protein F4822DRAFT_415016 [Hypoxylon trugodes]